MTKDEIIWTTLQAMRGDNGLLARTERGDHDLDDYEAIVIATLTERLPEGDIKACVDFQLLGVECCQI